MRNHVWLVFKGVLLVLGGVLAFGQLLAGQGQSGTHTLTCGPDKTIADAIKTLKPGDTLLVSGVCNENLTLGQEVQRITLDGQGTAEIHGAPSASAITIAGRGITIRGFHVTGGAPQGIGVVDGGSAVIDGNVVEFAERNGIAIFRNSYADILNNTIQNNPLAGIAIQYDSSARVGWYGPPNARISAPNLIQNNGAQGIQVYRGSSAQIFTNTIQNNVSHGVVIDRNAEAEVGANLIAGNGGDGIRAMRNSGLDVGTDANHSTPTFDDDTNVGTNAGYGVQCMIDGFVDGNLGALTGTLGTKRFTEGCTDSSQ
jgi:parallel beta helix pectate lyase-like protein